MMRVVQAMNNVLVTVDGKQNWRKTSGPADAVQWLSFHQDFEMCTQSRVDVDGLFRMPLIWYVDDLMM